MIDGYTEPVAAGELFPRAGGEGEGGGVALLTRAADRVVGDDPLVVTQHLYSTAQYRAVQYSIVVQYSTIDRLEACE